MSSNSPNSSLDGSHSVLPIVALHKKTGTRNLLCLLYLLTFTSPSGIIAKTNAWHLIGTKS